MSDGALFLLGWGLAALALLLAWAWQQRTHDASAVDAVWAAVMGALALLHAALGSGDGARRLALALLGGAWAARLALHLLRDRVLGKPEDGRYRRLRAWFGARAGLGFFAYFQAQALAAAVFALPFLAVAQSPGRPPAAALAAAVALWALAVTGESLADRQLAAWRADPAQRGRSCRAGLWRYSRHPNYFCEWLHWFTYPLLAWGGPGVWLALLGPALMLATLLGVTGIPHTERQALASRGEDYRAYQRETSRFVPWFPRSTPRRDA
ncbi:steroid 5-alpha reductase family enzyme [Plasticicumulans lactativorans]|uniref:Steroid 5-alpha reductase family enzyme n=1 Tax=Plasticicumulans lactativorans TaxID=1133106 RepID=A0A4R2L0W8_9GAMM|nr:steroid 5-alpha reductase family enzyme [Plasticicumulans lactativorans]